jgi:hypothetical protein
MINRPKDYPNSTAMYAELEGKGKSKQSKNYKVKMYFLHFKTEVHFHSDEFTEYLEQGWTTRVTKERRAFVTAA